jgi:hypothetical protein
MCARVTSLAVVILIAVGCRHDSLAPNARSPINLEFVAGDGQVDTIQSVLTQALILQVGAGPHGESGAHQVVRFQSELDSGTYRLQFESLAGGPPSTYVADTTDANGRVSLVVVLGSDTGVAKYTVTVPEFGYSGEGSDFIQPGNAIAIQAAPNDTDAYLGDTVALRTATVDRFGNPRSDSVSFFVLSGSGVLRGHTLTVNSYGPIQVVGIAAGFIDTTTVYGVPTGLMAAAGDNAGIFTFNLDGSRFTLIAGNFAGTLKWAPNGQNLAFDQTVSGLYGATGVLQTVQLNGQIATIVNSGSTALAYPQYARDGQWIYYDENNATQPLWRVHPDGTGDTTIVMASPEALQFPSPSPDGTKLSYIVGGGVGDLKVLTLSTGTAIDLGVKGIADVWSPTGNAIAYITSSNAMAIVSSNGTGQATIAPGPYGPQFDWSPDGQWIVARNTATTRLEVINVTTQLVVPLGYTGTVGSPTWH